MTAARDDRYSNDDEIGSNDNNNNSTETPMITSIVDNDKNKGLHNHHSSNGPLQTVLIGGYPEEVLLQQARQIVAERTKTWENANLKAEERIPRFRRDGTSSK